MNPVGVHLAADRGAKTQPLARTVPYCTVASFGVTEMCPVEGCRIVTGRHRCAEAELVVVPDLSFLHDVDALAASEDLAVSLLYIVSLGVDVCTKTQLSAVRGRPRHLPPQHCMRHVPAMTEEVTFHVEQRFVIEHAVAHRALLRIARAPRSKFTVSKRRAASGANVSLQTLRDVVGWACSVRRVESEVGPKAVAVDGVPMPA